MNNQDTPYELAQYLVELHKVDHLDIEELILDQIDEQDKFWKFLNEHPHHESYLEWMQKNKASNTIEWVMFTRAIAPIQNFEPGSKERYQFTRHTLVEINKRLFFSFLTHKGILNPDNELFPDFE